MPEVDQRRATCYHEAAHAVFASEVCRGSVRYVSADDCYCAASIEHPNTPASSWRAALYTRAGLFAEMLETWGEVRPETWEEFSETAEIEAEGWEEDRGDDYSLMQLLYGMGEPEESYQEVVRDTESQVRELWPAIVAVAERLSETGRVDGEECIRLIESAMQGEE